MQKFLEWTAWTMNRPEAYGAFHLSFWLIGLLVCFFLAWIFRKNSLKTTKLILFILGIVLLVFEVYKLLFYTYVMGTKGMFEWWVFPFQLCSVPMYLCIIQYFVKNEKVNNAIFNFLLAFSFFSGFVSFIEPSGLTHPYVTLTVHAFTWHLSLIFIGLILFMNKRAGRKLKDYLWGLAVFGICLIIAQSINIIAQGNGGLNMFYISPYVKNPIFIFSDLFVSVGWFWCSILYTSSIILGSFITFCIFLGISRLQTKLQSRKIKNNNI